MRELRGKPPVASVRPRVVVVAPFGSDGRVLERIVRGAGMEPVGCPADPEALARKVEAGEDILVLTAEGCRPDLLRAAADGLAGLPLWSAPPVVLIGERESAARQAALHLRQGRRDLPVAILMRPCEEIEIATALGVASETRAAQYRLRDLMEERRRAGERAVFLLDELGHRTANLFAMIKSLANHTLRAEPDPRAFRTAFNERIDALARTYGALRADDWEAADLETMVRGVVLPLLADGADADRVSIEGPCVRLVSGAVTPLGLALHELAGNARKYGALSSGAGRVAVTWQHPAGGSLRLSWSERGGPEVVPPARQGFGTRVIRQSLESLDGATVTLRHPPEGVTCEFVLPETCLAGPET